MKILITGAKGQLGNKLIQVLQPNHKLILTDSEEMDITDKKMVEEVISKEKPDFIIHAAAYTAVDKAETEGRELCYKVNALGTKNLAEVASEKDTTLLYISTDYVFPGTATKPILEDDPTSPVNYYGQTKLDGEKAIQAICKKYYIIRTAWLYGELPAGHPGSNFVETMLRLAKEKDEVRVVGDQIGSPTYTGDLVEVIARIIARSIVSFPRRRESTDSMDSRLRGNDSVGTEQFNNSPLPFGIYHVTGEGEASWYDFAKEIFKQTGTKTPLISITTADYPTPAKRPTYSYLSKEKLKKYGIILRPWQEALTEYLSKR